jgi:thiamine-phosphate pyrophosphorylase
VGDGRLADAAAEAAAGGVNLVQLREKDLPTRELLALAARLQAVLQPLGVPLVVNGRADVAFAASAAGVHLPADGLAVSDARAALGDAYLVGRSVHSANEARQSATEDLDYVVTGTIFPSPSHVDSPTIGVEGVRAAVGGRAPLIGIGGITPENAGSVIEAGADGVAVISAILGSSDPRAAAQELSQAVSKAWSARSQAYAAHR